MNEQNRRVAEIVAEQSRRLRQFIRRRVPDPADAEDLVQEVFYELVEANRRLMPIEHLTGWLFRVARNRIIDLFRKRRPEVFSNAAFESDDGESRRPAGAQPDPVRQLVRRPLSRQISRRLFRPLWGRPHPRAHWAADARADGGAGGRDDTRRAGGVSRPASAALGRLRAVEHRPGRVTDPGSSPGARRMRARDLGGRDDASTIVYERRRKRSAKGWGIGVTAPL